MNPCIHCGTCLNRCVYMQLDLVEAAAEMTRLDAGEPTPHIDRECMSCAACDVFCPEDAEPYTRILQRFYARYVAHGLPERVRYFMPTLPDNFRSYVLSRLPDDEQRLVAQWADNEPAGDVLYPGCNLITCAYLTESGVFDDLTIAGSLEACCGEMYFRFGLFDVVRRFAEKHTAYYRDRPIDRMVFACPAGLNMFQHILPERFGAQFDFPMMFVTDYLHELFDAGTLQVVNPLRGKVVMHDSCHARWLGPELMDSVRRLLTRLGLDVVEAEHSREDGFCCGIAAGAPRQSLQDMTLAVTRAATEYQRSEGENVATYCTGCYLTLASLPAGFGLGKPVRHVLEWVAEAVGRPVEDRIGSRVRTMLLGIVQNALPRYLSRQRFFIGGGSDK
ncbi:MAG: (Fe-S)-binding protein [Candidatus Lernaella stagnicola]|nr:(Fe-S)-binding protein [Candidatus Lernaella stagnicola]